MKKKYQKKILTLSAQETKEEGKKLAKQLKGGELISLKGELGAGKTTFTQGLLEGLEVKGPYTSPTFVIIKHYPSQKNQGLDVYHVDAYRVEAKDILALGWKEIISQNKAIVIVEWPERIRKILPSKTQEIELKWLGENKREIIVETISKLT